MPEKNVRVAIVDDDRLFRRALCRLLTISGMEVEDFASGQDFLDSLRSHRPDCLLLDLQMPGLSGREVQRALSRMDVTLPTIIITAHDELDARTELLAAGAAGYFRKPVERAELLAAIATAVDRGQAQD